jgi:serine phosphatase RsbU (regulator of sigma subunit)
MTTRPLDPVLARQLKRLKLDPSGAPPTPEQWAQLLDQVNDHFHHTNDDRALLNRSLELTTHEMDVLRRRVEAQRDRLSNVIGTIGEALSQFGTQIQSEASTSQVAVARETFANRLQTILNDSHIGDENSSDISLIRGNLVRLADQLIVLLSDTAERAVLKKELEVARAVQQLLVPGEDTIRRDGMQIASYFQPAAECGGDWWTVAELADGKVLTMIGDVTGHGVSSAIITGAAKAACELAIDVNRGAIDARRLLGLMNSALFRTARQQVMMTCNATIIDPAARSLVMANAGHPNPILVRQGIIHPLMAEGAPLGAAADTAYQQIQLNLEAGDVLACFTDGIVEAENRRGEQFSERRLRAVTQRAAPQGAIEVRDAVVGALTAFRDSTEQADDLTFVVTAFR